MKNLTSQLASLTLEQKRKRIYIDSENIYFDKPENFTGIYLRYYENGQLYEHWFYKNDKLHGEYKLYHENGQLWQYYFYENGKLIKRII